MTKLKFKARPEEPVCTTDPYYDLCTGGYIKPSQMLEEPYATQVEEAAATIEAFLEQAQKAGWLEYL